MTNKSSQLKSDLNYISASDKNPMPVVHKDPYANFQNRLKRAEHFCNQRFPEMICFKNLSVLDVGCGYGPLCVYAALQGAIHVRGIDITHRRIGFAEQILIQHYPQLCGKVEYTFGRISNLIPKHQFDIITSFAVLEHDFDPEKTLIDIRRLLKPGGKAYIGFGPLYRAMWGDHKHTKVPFNTIFPWAHLLFSKSWMIRHRNKKFPDQQIKSLHDLGLNGLPLSSYLDAIEKSGLHTEYLRINKCENPLLSLLFNFLSKIPGLRDLFAQNMYCVLANQS